MLKFSHGELVEKALARPGVKRAYDALEDEFALLNAVLEARLNADKTQEEVAKAMHTTTSVVGRLETGKGNPTLSTLRRYAKALGCMLDIRFIPISKRAKC